GGGWGGGDAGGGGGPPPECPRKPCLSGPRRGGPPRPTPLTRGRGSAQGGGGQGARSGAHRPATITGHPAVDDALSSYPLLVFVPHGRDPSQTPLVLALQGLAAPWQWNAFLVPTLLDMGIACALFDTPLAGERGLSRDESR